MQLKKLAAAAGALAVAAGLAACGGGDGGSDTSSTSPSSDLAKAYGEALASANTPSGLQNPALKESFEARYLDGGITKAMVIAAIDAETTAAGADASYSWFPQLTLSDATVADCNADGVCTLTGTLTNNDAESTAVPFSVRVVQTGGVLKLYGDQQAS